MNIAEWQLEIDKIIDNAIKEDITDPFQIIPTGDHSALACIPTTQNGSARLLVKANGILAGVELAKMICHQIDAGIQFEEMLKDGAEIKNGDIAFVLHGKSIKILQAERLILNFMQRMSGIATNTKKYCNAVAGTGVKILDTRKTTPGLRIIEKWAVNIGGGNNHRFGLYDMIMLKDNHIDFCGGITPAVKKVTDYLNNNNLSLRVEVEARTLNDVKEILSIEGVDRVMFDNFSIENVYKGVEMVNNKIETEVSGGITLDTIAEYAAAKPDFISVGALTHSSTSLDLSLKAI